MARPQTRTQKDLLRAAQYIELPFPTDARRLLTILALHDPRRGLDEFLDRFASQPADASLLRDLFGFEPPAPSADAAAAGSPAEGAPPAPADIRPMLSAALHAPQFQAKAMSFLLNAFPEKRREVFIHVPKCAGTDLSLNLGPSMLTVPKLLEATDWVAADELLGALADLARNAPLLDAFFVYGHMNLGEYVRDCGVRAIDRICTILRDPIDLLLSQANYSITRVRHDPEAKAPDTRAIRANLGLPPEATKLSAGELREAAVRALLDQRITQQNLICRYLGNGASDAETALDNLIRYDVEITDTRRYTRWMRERWNIEQTTRHNSSWQVLRRSEMMRLFRDQLFDRAAEDLKLYGMVMRALERSDNASVHGRDIARAVGSFMLSSGAPLPEEAASGGITVLQGDDVTTEANATMLPHALTGLEAVLALSVTFGREGNAAAAQTHGWGGGERGFTWSTEPSCGLSFPRPTRAAEYVMMARLTPFLARPHLAEQRVRVIANDTLIGEAALNKPSLIECVIPWHVLSARETCELRFEAPDAARPTEVANHPKDDRLLGMSFQWLRVGAYIDTTSPAPEPEPEPTAAEPAAEIAPSAAEAPAPLASAAPVGEAEAPAPEAAPVPAEPVAAEPVAAEPLPAAEDAAPDMPAASIEPPAAASGDAVTEHQVTDEQAADAPADSPVDAPAATVASPDLDPVPAVPSLSELLSVGPNPLLSAAERTALVLRFESLGENCEFGLVQRRCNAEPLGLLRFASAPYEKLLPALRARFAGLGEPGNLEVEVSPDGREYMIYDRVYGFRYHAWVKVGEDTPDNILRREQSRTKLLLRKLVEDLTDGAKLFVYHGMSPLTEEQAEALAAAVHGYGPGTLLWMECADAENAAGSVRRVGPGLLKGHMDRFAPGEDAHDLSLECWVAVCQQAARLMAEA